MKRKVVILSAVVVIVAAIVLNVVRLNSPYSSSYDVDVTPSFRRSAESSGNSSDNSDSGYGSRSGYGYGKVDYDSIKFDDDAESNSDTQVPLESLTLLNEELQPVTLSEIQGDRNLLLVVLRGAPLCPFCTAQTSRLVSNYTRFTELGAEVAVVFPGTKKDLKQLLTNARLEEQSLPFPILVDNELNAIRRLDIEADKARPSTFIIDSRGSTQFAYIGASLSDRPSIQVLLAALERIQPTPPAEDGENADDDLTE